MREQIGVGEMHHNSCTDSQHSMTRVSMTMARGFSKMQSISFSILLPSTLTQQILHMGLGSRCIITCQAACHLIFVNLSRLLSLDRCVSISDSMPHLSSVSRSSLAMFFRSRRRRSRSELVIDATLTFYSANAKG